MAEVPFLKNGVWDKKKKKKAARKIVLTSRVLILVETLYSLRTNTLWKGMKLFTPIPKLR